MMTKPGEAIRFLEAAAQSAEDECIRWPYAHQQTGYGRVIFGGKMRSAHRAALILATGSDPTGMDAAHSCGYRDCVNPRHLRWATRGENMAEAKTTKLSQEDRAEIKRLRPTTSPTALARRFGVTCGHIVNVCAGRG